MPPIAAGEGLRVPIKAEGAPELLKPKINEAQLDVLHQRARPLLRDAKLDPKRNLTTDSLTAGLRADLLAELDKLTDAAKKQAIVDLLNQEQLDLVAACDLIEECEDTWAKTGRQYKPSSEATKTGGLVGEEGKPFSGEFYPVRDGAVQPKRNLSDSVSGEVRGLCRLANEGNAEAKALYDQMRENRVVVVTYQSKSVSLGEFDATIETEADRLFMRECGGNGVSFQQLTERHPQIAQAFRIKAEQALAKDAQYSFQYLPEAPKPKPEAPKIPNLEERVNNALTAATALEQALFAQDGASPSPSVSAMVLWRERLEKARSGKIKGANIDTLTALLNSSIEDVVTMPNPPTLGEAETNGLLTNIRYYRTEGNNPLTKLFEDQLVALGVNQDQARGMMQQAFNGEISLVNIADRMIELIPEMKRGAQALSEAITRATSQQLTGAEAYILQTFTQHGKLETVTSIITEQLGFDPRKPEEFTDPRKYLTNHVDEILTHAGIKKGDAKFNYEKCKNNAKEYFNLTDEQMIQMLKDKSKAPGYIMFSFLMLLPYFQQWLTTSGGEGGQQAPPPTG